MLSGDNGILQKATQSKEKTERAEIVENAKLDILAKISEKKGENITASELEEILISPDYSTQGALSSEENILERTLTSKDGKYEIPVSEIYNGNLKTLQTNKISFTINDNGTQINFTCDEDQNWYEWAIATKSDGYTPSYWAYDSTLQDLIISNYQLNESSGIWYDNGDIISTLFDPNWGQTKVNAKIINGGEYRLINDYNTDG